MGWLLRCAQQVVGSCCRSVLPSNQAAGVCFICTVSFDVLARALLNQSDPYVVALCGWVELVAAPKPSCVFRLLRRHPIPLAPLVPPLQLVELVAAPELSALFSQAELAELLQCERAAAVLQMRNSEQQAAAAAGGQQQQQRDDGEAGEEGEGQLGGEADGE